VRTGSFDLSDHAYLEQLRGRVIVRNDAGQWLSKYPPGSSLAAVPVVLPVALFREQPLRADHMRRLGKLTAALSVAGSVALFYLLCRRLAPGAAGLASVLLAAGTGLWPVASQGLWSHGPATWWITLALFSLLRDPHPTRSRALVAGLALGAAVATRPTTILFAAASLIVLAWRGDRRAALACAGGLAPALIFLLAYNLWYFGAPVAGGYGAEARSWSAPFWTGFAGLLANPSRGLLVYTPAFLLLPFGVAAIVRHEGEDARKPQILGWLAAALATLVLYAGWHQWWGGWCFGPRFLSETLPILCLTFAFAVAGFQGRWGPVLARSLVVVSVVIQALGVFGHDDGAWNQRHPDGPGFTLHDTQIEAAARHFYARLQR
jgi:4-amino-4-deoxy-L-arabinose transferase-like glycosyltransferase